MGRCGWKPYFLNHVCIDCDPAVYEYGSSHREGLLRALPRGIYFGTHLGGTHSLGAVLGEQAHEARPHRSFSG